MSARPLWRRIPIDLSAFVVIAVGVAWLHVRYIRSGMCFNDPSWYFHFGHRALHGAVPYRDYIFQVGPLPIYVDAGFQGLFGERYVASLYAGLFITILRIYVMWLIVRRVADVRSAVALTVFCALDPLFSFAHHWSTGYAQLFLTTAGLMLLLASRAEGRRVLIYLALGGMSAALTVSARQSTTVMVGVVLLGVTTVMFVRKEFLTRKRMLALWGGFAAGLVLVFGALALVGALGPAIQQMFLDAPAKKAVHGIAPILDALSGGALVDWGYKWWVGFLTFLALPVLLVAAMVYGLARDREVSWRALAPLVVPIFVIYALVQRDAQLLFFSDLPRTLFTLTTVLAALFPDRARRLFGIEPIVLVGLGTLPLASDWALEMSFPGRGWGDAHSLIAGATLLVLATTRLTPRVKLGFCAALAAMAVLHFGLTVRDRNPFAKDEAVDGVWTQTHSRSKHPILKGLRITAGRKKTVEWLTEHVPAGSTCFVYGNMPVIYDILDCTNPTRVDSTAADFITAADAEAAIAEMRAHPPDYIIAHEKQWMSPPLTLDLDGDLAKYGGSLNPTASRAMHVGLRELLPQYEDIGLLSDALGPDVDQMNGSWDIIPGTRIYRRKAR